MRESPLTMGTLVDLTSKRVGSITALNRCGTDHEKYVLWRCRCDCGVMLTVRSQYLRRGDIRSCGCDQINQFPCDAMGCDRPARGYANGHRLCGTHYQRWKKFNSIDLPDRRRSKDGTCIYPGCSRSVGWKNAAHCHAHDSKLRYLRKRATEEGRAQIRDTEYRRKARKRRVISESFKSIEIFRRDGWTCQLCYLPVNRSAKWPHPEFPTIDHILPLAQGGEHTRRNVHCAHLRCNLKKNKRALGQLRLFG